MCCAGVDIRVECRVSSRSYFLNLKHSYWLWVPAGQIRSFYRSVLTPTFKKLLIFGAFRHPFPDGNIQHSTNLQINKTGETSDSKHFCNHQLSTKSPTYNNYCNLQLMNFLYPSNYGFSEVRERRHKIVEI